MTLDILSIGLLRVYNGRQPASIKEFSIHSGSNIRQPSIFANAPYRTNFGHQYLYCDMHKNSYLLTQDHSQASTDQTNSQNCSIKFVYCSSGIDPSTGIILTYYIILKLQSKYLVLINRYFRPWQSFFTKYNSHLKLMESIRGLFKGSLQFPRTNYDQ